ncbi:MAG: DUF488 domain-containing protein [Fimbriimonadales bacterium]|nr:DUF488 domain-containing protein [Fimbriimonadales bacterium]
MKVSTIGVYGWTPEGFVEALKAHGVQVLIDTRQRRGMRGREYRFANANALQQLLAQHKVQYLYLKALAPPVAIRQIQKAHDAATHTLKRERPELAPAYIEAYETQVLDAYDWSDIRALQERGIQHIALLCVETYPESCHRSLIARRLAERFGMEVEHILP